MEIKNLVIIGGGPIGLYLGICLAKQGHRVDLYEKKKWPINKTCGEGIMPSGVKALKKIGISFENQEFLEFNGITYIDQDIQLSGHFKDSGLGIARISLSETLYQLAQAIPNLHLFAQHELTALTCLNNSAVEINVQNLSTQEVSSRKYQKLFACDGYFSKTAQLLNLKSKLKKVRRVGFRMHLDFPSWSSQVMVYWNQGIEAYITPLAKNKLALIFLWNESLVQPKIPLDESLLDFFPEIKEKIPDSIFQNRKNLHGIYLNKKKSAILKHKNIYFLGDAYCFIDGITGEGLSLGFKSAYLIAYQKPLANLKIYLLYLNYRFWTQLALFLSSHRKIRRFVFKITKNFPTLFNKVLYFNDISFNLKS